MCVLYTVVNVCVHVGYYLVKIKARSSIQLILHNYLNAPFLCLIKSYAHYQFSDT